MSTLITSVKRSEFYKYFSKRYYRYKNKDYPLWFRTSDYYLKSLKKKYEEIFYKAAPDKGITICFSPGFPKDGELILKIGLINGLKLKHVPDATSLKSGHNTYLLKHKYATFFEGKLAGQDKVEKGKGINLDWSDISKSRVETVFEEVFGYGTRIDPVTHKGPAVEKSELNSLHNYRIIQCPIPKDQVKSDCIYQKVINNEEDGLVLDYRMPVHNGVIPLVYLKYRPVDKRFKNQNSKVKVGKPEDYFTKEELAKVVEFARRMNFNYAEYDVLKCKDDKRSYLIDVNNTPFGPPNGLSAEDQRVALKTLSASFLKNVLHQ